MVLDVVWLAGVLKPILDHRGVIENNEGRQVKRHARVVVVGELTAVILTRNRTHVAEHVFGRSRRGEASGPFGFARVARK